MVTYLYLCKGCFKTSTWIEMEQCLCQGKKEVSLVRIDLPPSLLVPHMSVSSSSSVSMTSESAEVPVPSNIIIANDNNIVSPPMSISVSASSSSLQMLSDTSHRGGKQFGCKQCDQGFSTRNQLRTHVRDMHVNVPVQCPHCTRAFKKNGDAFLNHLRIKHPDREMPQQRMQPVELVRPNVVTPPRSPRMTKKIMLRIAYANEDIPYGISPAIKIHKFLQKLNDDHKRVGKLYKNKEDISQMDRFRDCNLENDDVLVYVG
jgi:hypothetical protein